VSETVAFVVVLSPCAAPDMFVWWGEGAVYVLRSCLAFLFSGAGVCGMEVMGLVVERGCGSCFGCIFVLMDGVVMMRWTDGGIWNTNTANMVAWHAPCCTLAKPPGRR